MTITEFARLRGKEPQAISRYLKRHPEVNQYTHKKGKTVELLPEAERLLDKVYPLPKPIEIIEDTESRKELIEAQKLIIKLQQRLEEQAALVAKAEAVKLLLEDKERQLTEAKAQKEEAEKEIDRLLKRSLWERIRNK